MITQTLLSLSTLRHSLQRRQLFLVTRSSSSGLLFRFGPLFIHKFLHQFFLSLVPTDRARKPSLKTVRQFIFTRKLFNFVLFKTSRFKIRFTARQHLFCSIYVTVIQRDFSVLKNILHYFLKNYLHINNDTTEKSTVKNIFNY